MPRPPVRVSRRDFLKAGTAAVVLPSALTPSTLGAQQTPREVLYNGIVLPSPWPPDRELSDQPQAPAYLVDPPATIDIDIGRQLFVDDFLIEESSLHRQFHRATYHPASPVLTPVNAWEKRDPHAEITGDRQSPTAMVFSDGVFFDPADRLFKMWYMAGYQQHTGLALSRDGINWQRPSLDVRRGSNAVSLERRDSSTVWLDHTAGDLSERYKMAIYALHDRALRLHTSRDGIHWRPLHVAGPSGDRSTFFHNPFRDVWVFSLRGEDPGGLNRHRRYVERREFVTARWQGNETVRWIGTDASDPARSDMGAAPQLYNLDAVAYESLLLGLFTIYRGERPGRHKPNEVGVGFSRDGFHWARPWREALIPVSEREGDWNWSNVQSAGGCCLVVGDLLYFYVSGRQGVPGSNAPGVCSTGLATLRRDGFASLSDQWPAGTPRRMTAHPTSLTTRPVRCSGRHLFVNADIEGELRVEALDVNGRSIPGFTADRCAAVRGNATRHAVTWSGQPSLPAFSGQPVRFRFVLSRARLYAFWVSRSPRGESGGYVGAGGPGYAGGRDV